MEKICKKCGRLLPIEMFYVHSKMADGHLNICKDCVKERISLYRQNNIERIREYDRERGKTKKRMKKSTEINRKRRSEVENYQKAHAYISKAVTNGIIQRIDHCEVCGKTGKTEGHHYDYARPQYVIWLCPACHKQYHLGKSVHAQAVREFVDARIPF